MFSETYKTFLIGLFVIIACIGTVLALLFLRPGVGDEGHIIHVRFTDISGINVGTRVTFAGNPIGEVIAIHQVPDAREHPIDHVGEAYFYELDLAIDSHVVVYDTDTVTIRSNGLLGEKAIYIIPHVETPGHSSEPVTNQILYGTSGDPLEQTFNKLLRVGDKAGRMMDKISGLIDATQPEIVKTLVSFRMATNDFDHLITEAIQTDLVPTVQKMCENIGDITQEMSEKHFGDSLSDLTSHLAHITQGLDNPEEWGQILSNFEAITGGLKDTMPYLEQTLSNTSTITGAIADGRGTVGKLIMQDCIYNEIDLILSKADLLMSDINNYGLLFQMNSNWKRERARRAADLNKVNSQWAAYSYFQNEIDLINLSLTRISDLIDRVEACQDMVNEERFIDGMEILQERINCLKTELE